MIEKQSVTALLELSEDELLDRLGREIGGAMELVPTSNSQKGREWLVSNRSVIREKVCGSQKVKDSCQNSDKLAMIAAVADALGGSGFLTAAVLLYKNGIEKFCEIPWNED